jgi:hypothetical protein
MYFFQTGLARHIACEQTIPVISLPLLPVTKTRTSPLLKVNCQDPGVSLASGLLMNGSRGVRHS